MRANRAYELIVTAAARAGALADRRGEHVEVVEIDSGEVVLFWDTIPARPAKLARALRADLGPAGSRRVPE